MSTEDVEPAHEDRSHQSGSSLLWLLGAIVVLGVIGLILWRSLFLSYVENYQLGMAFNGWTGKISILPRTGW